MKWPPILLCLLLAMGALQGQSQGPADFIVGCSLHDMAGNLWFGTSGRGIYRYGNGAAGAGNEAVRAGAVRAGNDTAVVHFTTADGLPSNEINALVEDRRGNIWVSTASGICSYRPRPTGDTNTKSFVPFPIPSPSEVLCMAVDTGGNLWFGTIYHGVYRYGSIGFTRFLHDETVHCILADSKGGIWVGSWRGGGVWHWDGGESFIQFRGLPDNMVASLMEDRAGNIWIGGRDYGACRYTPTAVPNAGPVLLFSIENGLCQNNVNCILEDSHGNIWFGSDGRGAEGGGLCRYDGKAFVHFTTADGLPSNGVMCLVEDGAGNIWIGTRDGGLCVYDGERFIHSPQP